MNHVWLPKDLREIKNRLKVNKLFLYTILNSFNLF